jgi:hypothetical protein
MLQARSLLEAIGRELQPVHDQLLHHPYLQALDEGRVSREKLRLFAGEQYTTIRSDLRSVAQLVSRSGDAPSRDFFLGVLQGERLAADALLAFARALGWSTTDLDEYEPLPGAQAYACAMAWLALYGTTAEVAAGYLINFPAWGHNCGRMSRILQGRYGLGAPDVAFFELFATPPSDFEASALAVIQEGLKQGAEERLVRRAARLLQSYEVTFWDTLYQASVGGHG